MKFLKIQKLDFLISLYIFFICASELMGGKTFPLPQLGSLHLASSVAIFFLPFVYSINDVITEVYGKEKTRSIIQSGLFVVILILISSLLFTSLPPSARFSKSEASYDLIFGQSARIALASLTAFILAELMDVIIFVKVRERFGKKKLWLRNNLSNFVSQFIDTAVFMILAFYALDRGFGDNLLFLTGLILPYWLLKCGMSVIETPLVYLGVKWLKK
jgi:uncharacterized integral membrane protein (TIGR00697 family)